MILPWLGIVFAVLTLDHVDCRQQRLNLNTSGYWRLNIGKQIALNRKQCELVAGGVRTFAGLDTVAIPRLRPARFISKAQLIR
jgi:hypothetical protein